MKRPGLVSALLYLGLSLLAVGLFLAATLLGDYPWVARAGGAAWVFLLSTVVLMPLVIPRVRGRMRGH